MHQVSSLLVVNILGKSQQAHVEYIESRDKNNPEPHLFFNQQTSSQVDPGPLNAKINALFMTWGHWMCFSSILVFVCTILFGRKKKCMHMNYWVINSSLFFRIFRLFIDGLAHFFSNL